MPKIKLMCTTTLISEGQINNINNDSNFVGHTAD